MADRIILDFETCMIEWDSDVQKGTEFSPDLRERKAAILEAMGYETVDIKPEIDLLNFLINRGNQNKGRDER